MKRIISILISIIMIVSCLTVYTNAASKYNATWSLTAQHNGNNYTSDNTVTVKPGDTVKVKLHFKNNYYTGPLSAQLFYSSDVFSSITSSAFNTSGKLYATCGSFTMLVDWDKLAQKDEGWPKYDAAKLAEFKKTHHYARLTMSPNAMVVSKPAYSIDEDLITMDFKVSTSAKDGATGEIVIPVETMRNKSNPGGFLFCGIYTSSSMSSQLLQYSDDQSFDCTKAVIKVKVSTSDLGDVNLDKKINSTDALWVLEASVQKRTLTSAQKKNADVTLDGKINSSDALQILRYTVGQVKF